jgi:hypothetical protein
MTIFYTLHFDIPPICSLYLLPQEYYVPVLLPGIDLVCLIYMLLSSMLYVVVYKRYVYWAYLSSVSL